jgi:hypothetical protein
MTHVVLTDVLAFQILDDIYSDDGRCENLQLDFRKRATNAINQSPIDRISASRPPLAQGLQLTQVVADSDGPHW